MLTPWFSPGDYPIRDGVYLVRRVSPFDASECWHACRWDGRAKAWFSAGSKGRAASDLIGASLGNRLHFQWRGLTRAAASIAEQGGVRWPS